MRSWTVSVTLPPATVLRCVAVDSGGVIFSGHEGKFGGRTPVPSEASLDMRRAGGHSSGDCFPSGLPTVLWRRPKAAQMLSMARILRIRDSTLIKKKFSSPQTTLGNTG